MTGFTSLSGSGADLAGTNTISGVTFASAGKRLWHCINGWRVRLTGLAASNVTVEDRVSLQTDNGQIKLGNKLDVNLYRSGNNGARLATDNVFQAPGECNLLGFATTVSNVMLNLCAGIVTPSVTFGNVAIDQSLAYALLGASLAPSVADSSCSQVCSTVSS